MPFCTSCGKEVPPGKKFCEYCGAAIEQPAPAPAVPPATPAAPVSPQPVPAPAPAGGSGKTLAIAGIVILIVVIAAVWFVGLPMITGTTTAAKPPVTSYQAPAGTPLPTLVSPVPVIPVSADTPAASQTYEEKYTETYNQVYTTNHAFIGGQRESVPVDARSPPLYVKYNITPKIEVGEKVNEVGDMITTSYVSPNAWFKVNVYDAGNGALVEEQGFNKGFSTMTRQEFMVRAPGTYKVEISGNDVVADVRILTGKS